MISGQKVVCVDDAPPVGGWRKSAQAPIKGSTYVIRDLCLNWIWRDGELTCTGDLGLLLVGLSNPNAFSGQEIGFRIERFRLAEDQEMSEQESRQFTEACFLS